MRKHLKDNYFERNDDWSFFAYRKNCPSDDMGAQVTSWTNGVRAIADCSDENCCSRKEVDRALIAAGRYWLKDRLLLKRQKKHLQEDSVDEPDSQRPSKVCCVDDNSRSAPIVGIGTMCGGKVTQHFNSQNVSLALPDHSKDSTVSEPDHSEKPQKTASERNLSATYVSIRNANKWTVSRGCVVEDRIYMYCITHPSLESSLLGFFVLDITDPLMTAMFEESEEQIIRNAFPPLQPPDDSALLGMKPYFNVKSLDCLQDALSSDSTYGHDATSSWIRLVHQSFNRRLRCRPNEKLIHINLLTFVYELLDTIHSINNARTAENPWLELAQIIQAGNVGRTPIGAVEISEGFEPKLLGGSRALRLKLRNMLVHLHDIVGTKAAHEVQTVGIIVTGRRVQIVRCWARKCGGVVLLQPSDVQEFPSDIEHIMKLQDMVKHIVMGVQVLRHVSNVLMESQRGEMEARFVDVE